MLIIIRESELSLTLLPLYLWFKARLPDSGALEHHLIGLDPVTSDGGGDTPPLLLSIIIVIIIITINVITVSQMPAQTRVGHVIRDSLSVIGASWGYFCHPLVNT